MTPAVHQLLPVFSPGDAIGGAVRRTQGMLRALGFRSEIFALLADRHLASRPATDLLGALEPGDAVMYHLSIGSPAADLLAHCGARRIVVYHNITPAAYYAATSPEVTYWLERGRRELRHLVALADLVVADSAFNLEECLPFGPRRAAVVPPPVDLDRLRPRPSRPEQPPRILVVGRIAPNKRHDVLLRALAALRDTAVPGARLHVVGGSFDTGAHLRRLRELADRLGVGGAVEMAGDPADDGALAAAYARASVVATASEHEGFCVPLLEAMAFEVPIVARAAAAVPGTLGGAGVLIEDADPLLWAEALARTIGDGRLRDELIRRGRRRLSDFADAAVQARLGEALAGAGVIADPRAARRPR